MGYLNFKQAFKRGRETIKGFTLLELLVVVTVVLVLSSIAMFLYQRGLAFAKETVCETNLRGLQESVMLYSTENEALPASLGDLRLEHLEKGYAKAMEKRGWLIKASTFLIKLDTSDHAYAQFLTYDNLKKYGVAEKIFYCPADHDGGASYGMNGEVEGKKWVDVGEHVIVVADSDNYVFHTLGELPERHRNRALGIKKSGVLVEVRDGKAEDIDRKKKKADDDGDITICHRPGTSAQQTKTVSNSEVDAHLAHGDTMGACN